MRKREFPAGVHLIGAKNAAISIRRAADRFYEPIIPTVVELRQQGLSLRAIAKELDRRGIRTRTAVGIREYDGVVLWDNPYKLWNAAGVKRVLDRASAGTKATAKA